MKQLVTDRKLRCVVRSKSIERMKDILEYINEYTIEYRRSPSTRDIAKSLGIGNSTVYRYIKEMSDKGIIEYDGKEIITSLIKKTETKTIRAALLGSVSCGVPLLEEENIEKYVSLPASLFPKGEYFLLRANGDSMIEAGIEDRDIVIIRKQKNAENGDIVVALLEDGSTTLKRLYLDDANECIILHPENKELEDIVVKSCMIQGVAVKVMKDLR